MAAATLYSNTHLINPNILVISWSDFANFLHDGYRIYRSQNGGAYYAIAEVGPDKREYTDSNWDGSKSSRYRIVAFSYFDGEGDYIETDEHPSFLDEPTSLVVSRSEVNVTWVDMEWEPPLNNFIEFYRIYRSDDDGVTFNFIEDVHAGHRTHTSIGVQRRWASIFRVYSVYNGHESENYIQASVGVATLESIFSSLVVFGSYLETMDAGFVIKRVELEQIYCDTYFKVLLTDDKSSDLHISVLDNQETIYGDFHVLNSYENNQDSSHHIKRTESVEKTSSIHISNQYFININSGCVFLEIKTLDLVSDSFYSARNSTTLYCDLSIFGTYNSYLDSSLYFYIVRGDSIDSNSHYVYRETDLSYSDLHVTGIYKRNRTSAAHYKNHYTSTIGSNSCVLVTDEQTIESNISFITARETSEQNVSIHIFAEKNISLSCNLFYASVLINQTVRNSSYFIQRRQKKSLFSSMRVADKGWRLETVIA